MALSPETWTAVRALLDRVKAACDAGTLTRDAFTDAWRELEGLLGDGDEAEVLGTLILYALDEPWVAARTGRL